MFNKHRILDWQFYCIYTSKMTIYFFLFFIVSREKSVISLIFFTLSVIWFFSLFCCRQRERDGKWEKNREVELCILLAFVDWMSSFISGKFLTIVSSNISFTLFLFFFSWNYNYTYNVYVRFIDITSELLDIQFSSLFTCF